MPTPTDIRVWRRVVLVAVYLAPLVIIARLLVSVGDTSRFPWYVALAAAFFFLFSLVWIRPSIHPPMLHLVFLIQSAILVALVLFDPEHDYVADLFAMLTFQVAAVFRGIAPRLWIILFIAVMFALPMALQGALHGLGLALTRVAIAIALAALATASQDVEAARDESQAMLSRLETANAELKTYAAQVDDLAGLQERNRLARELHDSVSQAMFSIVLTVRSMQVMRDKEPAAVPAQLELLQGLTQDALARMRGFIADIRPKS